MNESSLLNAIYEAELRRAARVAASVLKQDTYYGGKETAAAKRASMDLTRALAAVRRPG